MPKLSSLIANFEDFWPVEHAENWDNVGLVTGDRTSEISRVLVSVDLTHSVIDEALANDVQLILTHHPVLYKAVTAVAEDQLKGALLGRLIRSGIAAYAAHTNADTQVDGSSSLLAAEFGIKNLKPLVQTIGGFGHACIGQLEQPIRLGDLAKLVSGKITKTTRGVAFSGDENSMVQSIAVCGGAGDSFLNDVIASDADVYITSDLRHHPVLDAIETPRQKPLALLDISHFAAERLWTEAAAKRLSAISGLEPVVSCTNTDVWNGVIH